jgi:cytochrome c oxidase subunit 4
MSSVTQHPAPAPAAHHHPSDLTFIKVALILAVITGIETSTYWWMDDAHDAAMVTLFVMMGIKFFMILLWFMHLKFDSKLFSLLFYLGLFLAVGVYMVTLFTFQFFA